ncbi:type IV fimbrial biogenesis protein FimT [Ectothiorhodosinus mongolicus]|uniref:Type II secretion system protein H n=1 Tax=Ectothiorhodosinus mongolicus TaxID=233100 RepID=A0A1R3VXT5_9GAMM|nr:GspH/FimT family pseudopilin [Ectothiorhodosinus mongolicus]ULX57115.1 hypothetical protein CKX93_05060 [Ectothiorhodosinus mongolicus]SIT69998.1 type IV fimbrial biogenesis protein FimT [Ectothiorhodosinus mongolicus]
MQKGWTLLEALVVMAIVGLLWQFASPGMQQWMAARTVSVATNSLASSLRLARSEAIARQQKVLLCPSRDGLTCTSGPYHLGWLIRLAPNDISGLTAPVASRAVLHYQGPLSNGVSITANGAMASYIAYRPDGQTRQLNDALLMGTVEICLPPHGQRIVINRIGRARIEPWACANQQS